MKEKDRYLLLEFLFTLFLLLTVILSFGRTLAPYRLYLPLGLTGGFIFSWFNRDKQNSLIRGILNICGLAILAWGAYSLLHSSFAYKEIIIIFINVGIILEIILSFNSCLASNLTYMQLLSLPLFMGFPLFNNRVHTILVLIYFFWWAVILKLKFYGFLNPFQIGKFKRDYSLFFSAALFLVAISTSWLFFYRFSLGTAKKGGVFYSEQSKDLEVQEDSLAKEYRGLQDRLQDKIAGSISEFSPNDRHAMIFMLSSLIQETPYVMEVKKAEAGLIDSLRRPGPGLEKARGEEITFLMKSYLDKKAMLNIEKIKERIRDIFKKDYIGIRERFFISTRINKMQRSNSYQELNRYEKELQEIINNSSADAYSKRDLIKSTKELAEWKALEIYRKKLDALREMVDSLDGQAKKDLTGLLSDIDQAENIPDLKRVENKIKRLEYTVPAPPQGIMKEAEEILDIAAGLILPQEMRKAKERLNNADLPTDEAKKIEETIDGIKDMDDYKKLADDQSGTYKGILEQEKKSREELLKDEGNKLTSIKIIPDYSAIPFGEAKQLLAFGIYSDGSEKDLTLLGEWLGADVGIASVAKGKVYTHSVGRTTVSVEFQGITSASAIVVVEEPKLAMITLSPQNLQMPIKESLALRAEGYFSDSAHRDITSVVDWAITNPRIVKIEKGEVQALKNGKTQVYAEYLGIKSLPAAINVTVTLGWAMSIIAKGLFFIILGIAAIYFLFYVLTAREKNKLRHLLKKNHQEFIIGLYENAKHILAIFGAASKESYSPLFYADLVEKRYAIEDNLFSRFTLKFEEAKYSRHILEEVDCALAMSDYNSLLKILFNRQNKLVLFLKYGLALFKRRPFFIS